MLTDEENKRRYWGELVILRQLFEDKRQTLYSGSTSCSPNLFSDVRNCLEHSALVHENKEAITKAASEDRQLIKPLHHELMELRSRLVIFSDYSKDEIKRVDDLLDEITLLKKQGDSDSENTTA